LYPSHGSGYANRKRDEEEPEEVQSGASFLWRFSDMFFHVTK
jgi:hypothetical protein